MRLEPLTPLFPIITGKHYHRSRISPQYTHTFTYLVINRHFKVQPVRFNPSVSVQAVIIFTLFQLSDVHP